MAEAKAALFADGTGKLGKLVMLRGVVQEDGTSADVVVTCVSVTDLDGRAVDNEAVLDALTAMNRNLVRIRKGLGEALDNMELSLDVEDEDDGGEDDGGES